MNINITQIPVPRVSYWGTTFENLEPTKGKHCLAGAVCKLYPDHSAFNFNLPARKALRFVLCCANQASTSHMQGFVSAWARSAIQSRFQVHDPQSLHKDLLHWDLSGMERRPLLPLHFPMRCLRGIPVSAWLCTLCACLPPFTSSSSVSGWDVTEGYLDDIQLQKSV